MPSYMSIGRWTQQGLQDVKGTPERLEALKQRVREAGGRVIFFYVPMGEYDFATLIEVPDDATAARLAIEAARAGNGTFQTLRAFTEEETAQLLASLS